MVEDRGQVAVGEPAGHRGQPESLVDGVDADEGGQLDGPGHLRADPLGADRGGLDQPAFGAVTQRQEGALRRRCAAGAWATLGPLPAGWCG